MQEHGQKATDVRHQQMHAHTQQLQTRGHSASHYFYFFLELNEGMWKPFFFLSFLEDSRSSVFSAETCNARHRRKSMTWQFNADSKKRMAGRQSKFIFPVEMHTHNMTTHLGPSINVSKTSVNLKT